MIADNPLKDEEKRQEEELRRAQEEWDHINVLPIIDLSSNLVNLLDSSISSSDTVQVVRMDQVENYYQNLDLTSKLGELDSKVKSNFWFKWLKYILFDHTPIKSHLKHSCDRIFALAKYKFDNRDSFHFRFLVTIYRKLTLDYRQCPRLGSHWQEIGFQGTDPATDLRGVGILGLYQLLYLILNPDREQLAKDIYKLSLDKHQNFPFAAMSTNITSIALQALRMGRLNKAINSSNNVQETFNSFYVDLFFIMYQIWKDNHKTIHDAGYILKGTCFHCS